MGSHAMKQIKNEISIPIPEGVTVNIRSRHVEVKGKYGTLKRTFKHIHVDAHVTEDNKIRVIMWHGLSKNLSCLRTFCSHVSNMMTGVMKKYEIKMRLVYSHFPININVTKGGKCVEIRNFLGEKVVRVVDMNGDTKIDKSAAVKDEIILVGTDLELVSRSAASIHQACLCKKKDIRKFLDGIYVTDSGVLDKED